MSCYPRLTEGNSFIEFQRVFSRVLVMLISRVLTVNSNVLISRVCGAHIRSLVLISRVFQCTHLNSLRCSFQESCAHLKSLLMHSSQEFAVLISRVFSAHFKSLRCSFQESTVLISRVFTVPASGLRIPAFVNGMWEYHNCDSGCNT